eukprot:Phypoly_transcript_00792.p1 GENE.Phypoly_transcript_00792~~Phypoly_transcript_00792.p1  ORF type:complete len:859 (-),score=180.78 Phypoly_transcript_00792:53-2629(-)
MSVEDLKGNNAAEVALEIPSVPWDRNMLSVHLQQTIAEILPSADPIDTPEFNPIEYINTMFPNEQSLIDIDTALGKVKSRIQRIDEEILREVRTQSRVGTKAKTELNSAQGSITDLFAKIHDIKAKAEQSERMVTEICRDIKSLDHAKTHLTSSITTLRRLQMLINAVDQLRDRANTRQYKEVANLLQAVNQLFPGFSEFKTISKVQDLNTQIAMIKADLNKQIYEEFNRYDSQLQVGGAGGGSGAQLLSDVCFVIDALGEVTKNGFLTWYIESQLRDYKQAFPKGSDVSKLDSIERRYAWLKREFRYFDDTYAAVFPESWKIPQSIANEFCITTRLSLSDLLQTSKNSLDIVALVNAVKKTIEFEKELCSKFQESERPIIHDDDEEEENKREEPPAEDEDNEDFTTSPYTAAAIKKKWERHQAMKEREKKKKLSQQKKKNPPAAMQFKGMISTCFDPYMDLYIQQEDRNMREMLNNLVAGETWLVPEHESNKVLASSTDLIYYFNEARKRCGSLTKGQPFYELFMLFKTYLREYAAILNNRIGEEQSLNSTIRPLNDRDEHAICLIVNTADYCSKTTIQMTEIIRKMIDERFKDKIDFTSEADAFSNVTAKALKALATNLEAKLEPALHTMAKGRWDSLEVVEEQSAYVSQIDAILKATAPVYQAFFSAHHFKFLCETFITSFISRGIIQNMYKCRRISEVGAQQLLLDFATLKQSLLLMAGQPPPKGYPRLVTNEIARAEALPRLIITANDIIVDTYRALMPTGSEGDFTRVLELKGVKREEKNEIIQRYNAAIANMPSAPTPISSLSHLSSSPASALRSATPPLLSSNPLSLSSGGASFLKVKKLIPDSLLNLNK